MIGDDDDLSDRDEYDDEPAENDEGDSSTFGHQTIRDIGKTAKLPTHALLALSQNDPFWSGATASSKRDGEWFAELFHRLDFPHGVHLRRIHYRLPARGADERLPDGQPYENSLKDWQYPTTASRHARYMGLVDIDAFDDRRNPPPEIHLAEPAEEPEIIAEPASTMALHLPETLPAPSLSLAATVPTAVHLEIWCEKSTMNDVLLPLAEEYGLNIVTGLGEMSLTACRDLIARIHANGDRPTRILYVAI